MVEESQCSVCQSSSLTDLFKAANRQFVRCSGCQVIFRKQIKPQETKTVYQTDSYQAVQPQHKFREGVFQKNIQEIEKVKGVGRILDVGCGEGKFLDIARNHGWETYGVELSPMAFKKAKKELNLDIFLGELSEARYPGSYFDVVTLFNVLDQLPSPLDELSEIYRILKDRGLLIIRVPNATFHVNLFRMMESLEPQLVFHLYCFTPMTIKFLLQKLGYENVSVSNSNLTPNDPYSVSPLLKDKGMQTIKKAVYAISQGLFYLSAKQWITGPSMVVYAFKGKRAGKNGRHQG